MYYLVNYICSEYNDWEPLFIIYDVSQLLINDIYEKEIYMTSYKYGGRIVGLYMKHEFISKKYNEYGIFYDRPPFYYIRLFDNYINIDLG